MPFGADPIEFADVISLMSAVMVQNDIVWGACLGSAMEAVLCKRFLMLSIE